jgi:hypothetical protein
VRCRPSPPPSGRANRGTGLTVPHGRGHKWPLA